MAFDPISGNPWEQENGEDAFDELNLVEPGMNSGWVQIMGPSSRVPEYGPNGNLFVVSLDQGAVYEISRR